MISMNLSKLRKRFEKKHNLKNNRIYEFFTMLVTFFIVCIGLILFRAESVGQAWTYFQGMSQFGTLRASYRFFIQSDIWPKTIFIILMIVVEWIQREKEHGLDLSNVRKVWLRATFCIVLALVIYTFAYDNIGTFIYFQF